MVRRQGIGDRGIALVGGVIFFLALLAFAVMTSKGVLLETIPAHVNKLLSGIGVR